MVTESVIWRLESSTRYKTLNRLTTDWDNITAPGITQPPMNLVDETRLKRLGISITEPWRDIISGYRAISRVLDEKNDDSGISGTDNNMGAGAGDKSGTEDAGGTSDADNNSDSKNAHAKAGFSTYNVADTNTDVDAGDITGMGDAGGTTGMDNNIDGKNAYAKAGFSTYNVAGANADEGAGVGDTSSTGEKVSNNIDNIDKSQSVRVSGTNKGGVNRTNKGEVGETNIKVEVGMGGADKRGISGANKGGVSGDSIEAGKKAGAGAITSINNGADGGDKDID